MNVMPTLRRRRLTMLTLLAAALAAVGLWALTRDGERPVLASDPHAKLELPRAELDRLLRATAAASSGPQAELEAEGRRLFRSAAVAKRGESCQTCHTEGAENPLLGSTPHPVAGVAGDFTGPREPPPLFAVGQTAPYFWVGDAPTLQETSVRTIKNHFVAPGSEQQIAANAAALVAYMKTIKAPVSDFDLGTLSTAALRGETVFQGKGGCIGCHGGPQFTDNVFHNLCVPKTTPADTDPGIPQPGPSGCPPERPGAFFNTPQLRDVVNSAPYMHNGVLETLREVVEFYNTQSIISPLSLTPAEISDLVAYLEAL